MKVAILNYTGTVGKTTLAVNLLLPRMNGAEIIAIESINEAADSLGVDVKKIAGERFREIFSRLLMTESAIVDVGASNIEDFLNGMAQYEDSQLEFDFFLLPVTPGTKEQIETIAMYKTLLNYGISVDSIKIVCNRVKQGVFEEFEILAKFAKQNPSFPLLEGAAVMENDLFDMMGMKQTSLQAILADETDYKTKIKTLNRDTDGKLIKNCVEAHTMRSLAKTVDKNLTFVFQTLLGDAS